VFHGGKNRAGFGGWFGFLLKAPRCPTIFDDIQPKVKFVNMAHSALFVPTSYF
jgi:hypothetical protein